jgi:hypothetical protein
MAKPNYAGIVSLFESAHRERRPADDARRMLREGITAKDVDLRSFDYGQLWAQMFGWNDFHHCRSTGKLACEVMEASGPVTTASFQMISNEVIRGLILEAYQAPEFIFSKLIPVRQTQQDFEKVIGVSDIGDEAAIVKEGDDYPVAGMSEQYRHAPVLRKRGFKVQLTREVLFFDKSGQLQQKASAGSKSMGQNREKRAIDCVIDENAGAVSAVVGGHRYHYLGNSIANYGNDSGNHAWDNLSASTALVDWTDIEACAILLDAMLDPVTAEPIIFNAKHLVCSKQLELTALRIRNATEITVVTPGYATSGNPTETAVGNPYGGKFDVLTSPYVAARLATDTTWFYGDVTVACEYAQAWPEEVKTLAGGTQIEFDRDIVQQYRFSEYGNYSVKEPRALIQATVA